MRRFLASCALVALLFRGLPASARTTDYYDPERLLSDVDLTDTASMTKRELQELFARGFLGAYTTTDVNGVMRSAADIVWRAAQTFNLNPQFLAVLLQREQSLVESPTPSQDQLDWAMGYSICDDCQKFDPRLAKYKGFGPQVYYAAQKIRTDYLADLQRMGRTKSGMGIGVPVSIDGRIIIPQTKATAVLYTYTPHLHGNENFVRIWNGWFVPDYPSGSLLQDTKTSDTWLIRNGQRFLLATKVVRATSFPQRPVVRVGADVLNAYAVGPALREPNYSLLRTPDGVVSLIVDDAARPFASADLVRQIGFDPSEVIDVAADALDGYLDGLPLESAETQPYTRLLQDTKTGGVYAEEDGVKHPIISREILAARFNGRALEPTTRSALDALPTGAPISFPDGVLIMAKDGRDVFVISNGERRRVMDEKALAAYGWNMKQVIRTNQASVNLHPEGAPIHRPEDDPALLLL